jgi:hypothetical protein
VRRLDTRASIEEKQRELPYEIGFRTGYADSPYDLPGGFFYGAYFDDKLLTQEDGVPYGSLSGEVLLGLIQGNAKKMTLSTALLGQHRARLWVNTLELEPSVKYHFEMFEPFEPYLLAGPSIFVPITENAHLIAGQVPLPRELQGRRLPQVTDASLEAGAAFGTGFRYSLSQLRIAAIRPILRKTALGAEWRYNYMHNGEQFQQYTGSISFGF